MDSLFTNKTEKKRRYDICKDCMFFREGYKFLGFTLKVEKCDDCGCPIVNKLTIKSPKCQLH